MSEKKGCRTKPSYRDKQGHKTVKCERNRGVLYETKKQRLNLSLTPAAIDILDEMAKREHCSISELLERWVRGKLEVDPSSAMEQGKRI